MSVTASPAPICHKHQTLLVTQANYGLKDPWRALVVMANVALFQGATCDPRIQEELAGDVTRIGELGCLACRKPDLFGQVVQAAQTREPGAIKALGDGWVAVANASRKA